MSLAAAIKRAKRIVKDHESRLSDNKNSLIIATEFNSEPHGSLVIILKELDVDTDCGSS